MGASDMGRRLVLARLLARANSSEVNGHHTLMGASVMGRRLVLAMLLARLQNLLRLTVTIHTRAPTSLVRLTVTIHGRK